MEEKKKLLHRNSKGVSIYRTDKVRRSVVSVEKEGHPPICRYHFKKIPESFDSPYISWANLDCCNGWSYDEEYLHTAVQQGKKLYAGTGVRIKDEWNQNYPSAEEIIQKIEAARASLPDDVLIGVETWTRHCNFLPVYICKTGRLSDYYDLNEVFAFYEKLGFKLNGSEKERIIQYCDLPISDFAKLEKAPFNYACAGAPAAMVVTGLLLGYPIESTVALMGG